MGGSRDFYFYFSFFLSISLNAKGRSKTKNKNKLNRKRRNPFRTQQHSYSVRMAIKPEFDAQSGLTRRTVLLFKWHLILLLMDAMLLVTRFSKYFSVMRKSSLHLRNVWTFDHHNFGEKAEEEQRREKGGFYFIKRRKRPPYLDRKLSRTRRK